MGSTQGVGLQKQSLEPVSGALCGRYVVSHHPRGTPTRRYGRKWGLDRDERCELRDKGPYISITSRGRSARVRGAAGPLKIWWLFCGLHLLFTLGLVRSLVVSGFPQRNLHIFISKKVEPSLAHSGNTRPPLSLLPWERPVAWGELR